MLYVPKLEQFAWQLNTASGTRFSTSYGTSISATSPAHTKGGWQQLATGGTVAHDVWGIQVNAHNVAASASSRSMLLDIGIDPAGGTSYSVIIPNLMIGDAGIISISGGFQFYFPLFIPAGASIAGRVQSSTTSATTRVWLNLYGKPTYPELTRVGFKVQDFGTDTGTSAGTTVTPGTTIEGSWTQIGSSLAEPFWWWQFSMGSNDTAKVAAGIAVDVAYGNATDKRLLIEDASMYVTTVEAITLPLQMNLITEVPTGQNLYIRLQTSGALDTGTSCTIYGLR